MAIPPYSIELRPAAMRDLAAIAQHIAKDNPARAASFVAELRNKLSPLAQHPNLGRTGRPGLPKGIRELSVHRNYIAFYRVLASKKVVEVVNVKHAAQRLP